MKLDDVVEVNLVDRSPKETYRPVREMATSKLTAMQDIISLTGPDTWGAWLMFIGRFFEKQQLQSLKIF